MFGGGGAPNPFGTPTSTNGSENPFGKTTGANASPFGGGNGSNVANASAPFGALPSPFAAPLSPFGGAAASGAFGGFGASASMDGASPFGASGGGGGGGSSGAPTSAPLPSAGSSPFGAAMGASGSPFGVADGVSAFSGAGSGFGKAVLASSSPFGASAAVSAGSPFRVSRATGRAFGAPASASASPFGASAPASTSTFGTSALGASPFGATQGSTSPFGSAVGSAKASPFGGSSTAPPTSASPFEAVDRGSSPFGASNSAPAGGTSPFGASTQPSQTPFAPIVSSPFDAAPPTTTSPSTSPSAFGAFTAPTARSPSPFEPKPSAGQAILGGIGAATASSTPAPAGSPFGGTGVLSGLSPVASSFQPKVSDEKPAVTSFGGFATATAAKTVREASAPAFGSASAKAFVPPKPRPVNARVGLTSQPPASSSGGGGGEAGELPMGQGHIIGTCDLMCPVKEREFRSANGDLEVFERIDANDRMKSHPDLCVKKYTRIVADLTPDMVRTKKGLQLAIDQLWRIIDGRDEDFMTKSKFLWDRLRSIRQDLNLQQITDSFAVKLMEQMVRYTILAEHELCEETASATNPDGHNSHLNVEQLTKTLTSLRHMYDDNAAKGTHFSLDAEAEMYCYQLLLRIDSHGRYAVQRSEMLNDLRGVRGAVLKHRDVQFALQCHRAYHSNNLTGFFRLVKQATFLQSCCLHKFFNSMRSKALEVMNSTYGRFMMPISEIGRLMNTDEMEAEALCIHHGLKVSRGKDGDKPPAVMMRESSYISPADEFPVTRSEIVMKKRAASYLLEIVGKEDADRILAKQLPSLSIATPQVTPKPADAASAELSEMDKRKKQADELRAKIAEREAALAAERAAIVAKKKELEERKAAERKAAEEAERKAKEEEEATRRAEEEAKAIEAKARAEAEAAEVERKRLEEETARAKAEAEAKALAEAERIRVEQEAERQRIEAERRAKEAAEAARLAAIAKAAAEERARKAAQEEAERQRVLAEERARHEAAEAKAARRRRKQTLAIWRLFFARWRMNSKELKRERLIGESLASASPAPGLNSRASAMFNRLGAMLRPTDVLSQLRHRIESARSPEFGGPLDIPQTVGMALHDAAKMAAPSALVWKCLICTGAEADSGVKASARPRTAAATLAAEWLRTKLSRGKPTEPTETGTGSILSLYGTRLPSLESDDYYAVGPLAWVIVRDVPAMMDASHGAEGGAAAAIFILDCGGGECEPHEMARLKQFYRLVRRGDAPLVIMVTHKEGSSQGDVQTAIDDAGVEGALVMFLPLDHTEWHDERLSNVLLWMAERAPKAPRRRIAHVSSELEEAVRPAFVDFTPKPRVSPNACVSAFNNAIDQVEKKILDAAREDDGAEWPPIEIGMVNAALPPPGWRSSDKRTKMLNMLHSARLPSFDAGDMPARAFIDYVAKVLPGYPKEYGRCMLAQAQYDPHFHSLDDVPWVALFQSLITLILSGLESRTRGECIYLPPGHPTYTFTPYEPEPELLASAHCPSTLPHADAYASPTKSTKRKRKHIDTGAAAACTNADRFEDLESIPLDLTRAATDAMKRDVERHTRVAEASERWLAAVATNTPGASIIAPGVGIIDTDVSNIDASLAEFNAASIAERDAERRLRKLLGLS